VISARKLAVSTVIGLSIAVGNGVSAEELGDDGASEGEFVQAQAFRERLGFDASAATGAGFPRRA